MMCWYLFCVTSHIICTHFEQGCTIRKSFFFVHNILLVLLIWDDPKSEGKDSNTDATTTGAQVGDTTTSEESTTPSGGASIGAHVSETKLQSPRPSHIVEEILGAHPIPHE